jgi:glycosyltransferase involved in cell wall biosynthesis
VRLIYNSFDEEDFDSIEPDKFSKFTIAHVGSIYGPRRVDLLLESIYELHKRRKITSDRFKLLLIGINDNYLNNLIESYGIEDCVEIKEPVSHREALKLMRKAHLLLLLKGFGKNSENQIPGKFFEYIGSGSKILYIGPDNNEVADILRSYELGYIINGSKDHLCEVILNELKIFCNGGNIVKKPSAIHLKHFSSLAMAKNFDRIICELFENNY